MRRVRTEEEKQHTLELQIALRSRSKNLHQRLQRIYHPQPEVHRLKQPSPSRKVSPGKDLRLLILSKPKTPQNKSPPAPNSSRHYRSPLDTGRRLEELKKRPADSRLPNRLNGTQKYFRKEERKKMEGNLNETLRMVWDRQVRKPRYQFKQLRKLGKSQTGEIILAVSNLNGMTIALKTFRKAEVKLDFLIDETKIQIQCNHPNILPAYGVQISNDEVFLAMEVGQCNLYDRIMRLAPFDQVTAALYLSQIASGVAYLHSLGVMHRDIKPQNIICFGHNLKIADFGWSIISQRPRRTLCGTLDYLSPQVTRRQSYNNKIDCWSIGVLMYQMLTGQAPFANDKQNPQYNEIVLPRGLSKAAKDLLAGTLDMEPVRRLSAREILQHQWIQKNLERNRNEERRRFRTLEMELAAVLK